MNWRERYGQSYIKAMTCKHPVAMATGYFKPKFPNVNTANGLTTMIVNFLNWNGHRATRVSSAGRYIGGNKWEGGGQWIPGPTRKGTADISATIKGKSVMIEVKVGKDKPSPYQLQEQERERLAGGIYEFIKSPEQFLQLYDTIMQSGNL